jgi:hypothetical protein
MEATHDISDLALLLCHIRDGTFPCHSLMLALSCLLHFSFAAFVLSLYVLIALYVICPHGVHGIFVAHFVQWVSSSLWR